MKDYRHISRRRDTVFPGQEVPSDHVNANPRSSAADDRLQPRHVTGRARKRAHVAEPLIQQTLYERGPDEAGGTSHQDRSFAGDYFCSSSIYSFLRCYLRS